MMELWSGFTQVPFCTFYLVMASYVDLMMTSTQVGPDGSCTYFLWSEIWHAHLWVLRWAAPQPGQQMSRNLGCGRIFPAMMGGGGHCSRTMLIRVSFHNFGPDSDLRTAIGWIALKFVQTWSLEDESYWFVDPLTCLLASWAHWHFCFFSFSLTCLDKHSIDCHDIFAWKKRMVDPEAGFSVCNSPSPSWDDPHDINGGYLFFSDSTSCCCEPSSAADAKQTYVQGFFVVVENLWTNPLICYYAGRSICVFVIYG